MQDQFSSSPYSLYPPLASSVHQTQEHLELLRPWYNSSCQFPVTMRLWFSLSEEAPTRLYVHRCLFLGCGRFRIVFGESSSPNGTPWYRSESVSGLAPTTSVHIRVGDRWVEPMSRSLSDGLWRRENDEGKDWGENVGFRKTSFSMMRWDRTVSGNIARKWQRQIKHRSFSMIDGDLLDCKDMTWSRDSEGVTPHSTLQVPCAIELCPKSPSPSHEHVELPQL